jgi:hypothetical protein
MPPTKIVKIVSDGTTRVVAALALGSAAKRDRKVDGLCTSR